LGNRLLALGAVILARLGFLARPVLTECPSLPLPALHPAGGNAPRRSLGLPGHWTPQTGGEP
jgi:hypothetical protein